MDSTWEFYAFRGGIDNGIAYYLWDRANNEANSHDPEMPIKQPLTWLGKHTMYWVELCIIPRQGLRWGIVIEAFAGALLASSRLQEYQFMIWIDGVEGEVGYGHIVRTSSTKLDALDARRRQKVG